MNAWEIMPMLLMLLFSVSLTVGAMIIVAVIRRGRSKPKNERTIGPTARATYLRPTSWLAVKSRNLLAVQSALGLHNPKPCSWIEGLTSDEKLFIAPPVKGWILVVGTGLPDPSEDVDTFFRFVMDLSRRLGQVQYFSASRVLQHHAWVKAEAGRVLRAYAWAGKTLWKQGPRTPAEKELGLTCLNYTDPAHPSTFGQPDLIATNVDKVPLLAARWSLDPARIDERFLEREQGIAGEPSRRF